MQQPNENLAAREWTFEERTKLVLEIIQVMQRFYEPGQDRIITPDNVFQQGRESGRAELEAFMGRLLLPGSRVEGVEHIEQCLVDMDAGKSIIFLPEHRGNFDVPLFNHLLRIADPRYDRILERLIYIAGRKLNESSDLVKMFTEKYSRLVIVPRRDFPLEKPDETPGETEEREAYTQTAARINRAAFRQLVRQKKAGRIFVLYPLGGRVKAGASNVPVRETVSYLSSFDRGYLISMEGNTLPPGARMEDERPLPDKVVFRFGSPLDNPAFLAEQQQRYDADQAAEGLPPDVDYEQYTVNRIMVMLENLRLHGSYGDRP